MNVMKVYIGIIFLSIIFSCKNDDENNIVQPQNKIKVFILAGQSNMQGHGNISPETTPGTLSNFVMNDNSNSFDYLKNIDGTWKVRKDVWLKYKDGYEIDIADFLSVGMGASPNQIGPELGFGHLLGNYYKEKILIIKTCWGGKSLAVDFRPHSSEGETGLYYDKMISDIFSAINNIKNDFPEYDDEEIEISGFCWFQGWNDGEKKIYLDEYEENLKNLIKDVRNDLNSPNLPFVIGLTGNGGRTISGDYWVSQLQTNLVPSQIRASTSKEFKNVLYAETRDFWMSDNSSPAPTALHHWKNNGESYLKIGNEMGVQMINILKNKQ